MITRTGAGKVIATACTLLASLLLCCAGTACGQQFDGNQILQKIDAAVRARQDGIQGYTDFETYAVYRSADQAHPAARMRVKTTYNRDTGKTYDIQTASGSTLLRDLVLNAILNNERQVNLPGVREGAWITTANYKMSVKPGGFVSMDGRNCVVLNLEPRRKQPYLLNGTLWVDASDGSIVRVEGTGSKNSSIFSGPTKMMRQYVLVNGFAEAVHARAEADSSLFGRTVVTIDYSDYQIQPRRAH
jgi:hypothetical protein